MRPLTPPPPLPSSSPPPQAFSAAIEAAIRRKEAPPEDDYMADVLELLADDALGTGVGGSGVRSRHGTAAQ